MRWFRLLVLVLLVCGCDNARKNEGSSVQNTLATTPRLYVAEHPRTHKVIRFAAANEDEVRARLGMVSKAEESLLNAEIHESTLLKHKGVRCVYVSKFETPRYFLADSRKWMGVFYDAGLFPVLAVENGFIKTADSKNLLTGYYDVVYIPQENTSPDLSQTDFAKKNPGRKPFVAVPELCSHPPNPA